MTHNKMQDSFKYMTTGIKNPGICDLASYITLVKKDKQGIDSRNTHLTTDKSSSQMRE